MHISITLKITPIEVAHPSTVWCRGVECSGFLCRATSVSILQILCAPVFAKLHNMKDLQMARRVFSVLFCWGYIYGLLRQGPIRFE